MHTTPNTNQGLRSRTSNATNNLKIGEKADSFMKKEKLIVAIQSQH